MLIPKTLQIRVNLRDLGIRDLGPRNHRHQPDALPHDGDQLREVLLERDERGALSAARGHAVARFAHSRKDDFARILVLLLRERGRRYDSHLQPRNHDRTKQMKTFAFSCFRGKHYCHAILNAS
jgi:hypothetical protein